MLRTPLIVLAALFAAALSAPAQAQWKWRDKNGVVQYSDLPPPPGIPAQDVLQKPSVTQRVVVAVPAPASAASGTAPLALKGAEPELEAKRRKVEQDKIDMAKAEEKVQAERVAAAKAENCTRARGHLRTLEDGLRMVRTNPNGEREVLDDKARAEEVTRAREIIASDCK
jgi:Domain of unknown function (DUF4124)